MQSFASNECTLEHRFIDSTSKNGKGNKRQTPDNGISPFSKADQLIFKFNIFDNVIEFKYKADEIIVNSNNVLTSKFKFATLTYSGYKPFFCKIYKPHSKIHSRLHLKYLLDHSIDILYRLSKI